MTNPKPHVFMPIGDLVDKIDRLVVHDPTSYTTKKGMEVNQAHISFLNDEDVECTLYLLFPPQKTFGPSETYDLALPEDQKTPDKLKGYQMMYPLRSYDSATNKTMTDEESRAKAGLDALRQFVIDRFIQMREDEEVWNSIPPGPAMFLQKPQTGFKPMWEFPKKDSGKKDKQGKPIKVPDENGAERCYWKLATSGEGEKLKVMAKFYAPGDVPTNPVQFLSTSEGSKMGMFEPIVRVPPIFIGGHGKLPVGASLKLEIVEGVWTPIQSGNNGPGVRLAPRNNAEPVEEDDQHAVVVKRKPLPSNVSEGEEVKFESDTPLEQMKKLQASSKAPSSTDSLKNSKSVAPKPVNTEKPVAPKTVAKTTTTTTATVAKKIVAKKPKADVVQLDE